MQNHTKKRHERAKTKKYGKLNTSTLNYSPKNTIFAIQ